MTALQALNEQQNLFITFVCQGMAWEAAASAAGYKSPKEAAWRLRHNPAVAAGLQEAMWRQMRLEDAPAARRVLREIMEDASASKPVRVECAKALLNRGGYGEPKAIAQADNTFKSPSEMTSAELQAAIEKMQGEIGLRASAAKIVEGNASPIPDEPTQVIDLLG